MDHELELELRSCPPVARRSSMNFWMHLCQVGISCRMGPSEFLLLDAAAELLMPWPAAEEAEEAAELAFACFAVLDISAPASGLLQGIRLEGILSTDCG